MTIADALRLAAAQLAPVSETPRLDAELLMAHALGTDRSAMLVSQLRAPAPAAFDGLVARRTAHEPIAYILGHQEFWSLDLVVGPAVLIPRADSETLIEAALDACKPSPPTRILDLGTGSGALLLAALSEWRDADGVGLDASDAALAIAAQNAERLGLAARAGFIQADWRSPNWRDRLGGPFDLVLANPPYVETDARLAPQVRDHEPHLALFAGETGLDAYTILIPSLALLLTEDGVAIFEIGAAQAESVGALAKQAGYAVRCVRDLSGHDRALIINRPGT